MSEYPSPERVQSQLLIDFVFKNIDLSVPQQKLFLELLNQNENFRVRVSRAYELFNKTGNQANKNYALVLLENIRDDLQAMLEG